LTSGRARLYKKARKKVFINSNRKEDKMGDSVYKVIQLVGTSTVSWEDAAKNAIERASKSLRDLRIAEISKLDLKVENGKVVAYRTRVLLSFKYEGGE
jgi:flavin-binding protein dodecin